MSKDLPTRPRVAPKAKSAFALVVSRYNGEFTDAMAGHAERELREIEPECSVERFDVPGAFEIPLIVKLLAERRQYQAILAVGVIIQGETSHADLIASSITESLLRTSLSNGVPVIHEVLLVSNEEQARARCMDPVLNRGIEAARAAVETVRTLQTVLST